LEKTFLNPPGKTTLIKLLTGLYQPNKGRILLDGTLAAMAVLISCQWGGVCSNCGSAENRLRIFMIGF